jgi:hypothetical protein
VVLIQLLLPTTFPKGTASQDVVMVEVVTDHFDRAWWRAYSTVLTKRFSQDVMHVRALTIELLSEESDSAESSK